MMPVTEEIRSLIMERASAGAMRRTAMAQGMNGLRDDGWRLVREGRTTVEEVVRNTMDEEHTRSYRTAKTALEFPGRESAVGPIRKPDVAVSPNPVV
jgi:hypothetical protein